MTTETTDTMYAAGQAAAYSAVADMLAAGFPVTEDTLRAASAAVLDLDRRAPTTADDATETGTPAWLEELLDTLTAAQRETYNALGCYRCGVPALAARLKVSHPAATQRASLLVSLGLAERVSHGVYRAIRK